MSKYLTDNKIATQQEITKLDTDTQDAVKAAMDFARKSPLQQPQMGLKNVYAQGSVRASQIA